MILNYAHGFDVVIGFLERRQQNRRQRKRCDDRIRVRERKRFEDASLVILKIGRAGHEPRNAGGLKKVTKPRKWAFF